MSKETKKEKQEKIMKILLAQQKEKGQILLQAGSLVKGTVIEVGKTAALLDLGVWGTGIVYGAELKALKEKGEELKVGDEVQGIVINPENDEGYVEISLREAAIEQTWNDLKEKKENKEIITVRAVEANRGGLIVRFGHLIGFLPASQLSPEHYPKVPDGDKGKIINALSKLINQELKVKVITLNKNQNKLVFSEKAASVSK